MADIKPVSLALQGGGSHGAFTWGVLDRLLEENRLEIEGVSATSAGAMNAAVLAQGLTAGGRQGAVKALADFWRRLAQLAETSTLQPSWYDQMIGNFGLAYFPGYIFLDVLYRTFFPYQFNPFS